MSDGAAVDVLMALSNTGASAAAGALEQVGIPEVRRYLSVVRADHQALTRELNIIVDSLQVSPEPNPAAERIRAAAPPPAAPPPDSTPSPTGSDAAVLEQQLRLHRLFLAVLDSVVLTGPRDSLLAQYATAMRPTVSAHLQRAEQLERLVEQRRVAAVAPRVPVGAGNTAAGTAPGTEPSGTATAPPPVTAQPTVPDTVPAY